MDVTTLVSWERIPDPLDRRKTVWWRGTWEGGSPAYLSVNGRDGAYHWAVRSKPGVDHVVAEGQAPSLAEARRIADRQRHRLA